MTAVGIPANAKQLAALVKEAEGPALEFKRSTGELKEGMQTLCAFLNGSGGMVLFGVRPDGAVGTSTSESGDQVTAQVAAFCREPQPAKAIMAELGLKHWKTFQANYLAPLMAMGILERRIPDKPRSRMQRYKTTEAGLAILRTHQVWPSSASRKAPMARGTRG